MTTTEVKLVMLMRMMLVVFVMMSGVSLGN